jgi:hypothetical protein
MLEREVRTAESLVLANKIIMDLEPGRVPITIQIGNGHASSPSRRDNTSIAKL